MLATPSSQGGTGLDTINQDNILLTFDATASYQGIFSGANNTCVHASKNPHCFGENRYSELTSRSGYPTFLPITTSFENSITSLSNKIIKQSVHGSAFSCYSTQTDRAVCAGSDNNNFGTLGSALSSGASYPQGVEVNLNEVSKKMCAGSDYTCSLSILGNVECWGNNGGGQIDGTFGAASIFETPQVSIASGDVVDLACLESNICVLKNDQKIYCKGGGTVGVLSQVLDLALENFIQLKGAGSYFCGATATGKLICGGWDNSLGQLGDRSSPPDIRTGILVASNDNSSKTRVPVFNFETAPNHACASTTKNRLAALYCWGDNSSGQVTGRAEPGNFYSPRAISKNDGSAFGDLVGDLALGLNHTCFQFQGGVSCFGSQYSISIDNNNAPSTDGYHPILPLVYR
jgi:alpha-tubulin suppressor-like RCC1 family protein